MRSASGATFSFADARSVPGMDRLPFVTGPRRSHADRAHKSAIDRAIEMKAVGVTPDYIASMQRAAPQIGRLDADDAVAMRALGITPQYVQQLAAAGFGNLDEDKIIEARAVGLTPGYIRSMQAAGVRGSLDDYIELRALGINSGDLNRARRISRDPMTAKKLVKIKTGDFEAYGHACRNRPSRPSRPSRPIDEDR